MKEKIMSVLRKIRRVLVYGLLLAFFGILKGSFTVAKKLHMQKGAAIALAGTVMLVIFCAVVVGVGYII